MNSQMIIGVLVILLAMSEGLSLLPQLQSNSILQLIINGLKALVPADKDPKIGK